MEKHWPLSQGGSGYICQIIKSISTIKPKQLFQCVFSSPKQLNINYAKPLNPQTTKKIIWVVGILQNKVKLPVILSFFNNNSDNSLKTH